MTRVINLVAPSGVGKTTLARLLEEENNRYNVIQSYTTRSPREKNEYGHTFIGGLAVETSQSMFFSNESGFHDIMKSDMIAYFNSYNSGHHYFATDEQVVRGKDNLYIVDPKGAEMVHSFYRQHNSKERIAYEDLSMIPDADYVEVITIFLYADTSERFARQWDRKVKDEIVNQKEIENEISDRLVKDEDIFRNVKCNYFINANGNIEEIKEELKNILEG